MCESPNLKQTLRSGQIEQQSHFQTADQHCLCAEKHMQMLRNRQDLNWDLTLYPV